VIAALLLCLGLLWWQLDSKTESLGTVKGQLEQSQAAVESIRATLKLQRELIADAAEFDRRTTQELTDAQTENDRLAAAVAAGTKRLRIKADCPRVPDTTSTPSLDDAGTAELSADSRPDYYALRKQLTLTEKALKGLQEYVGLVCLRGDS